MGTGRHPRSTLCTALDGTSAKDRAWSRPRPEPLHEGPQGDEVDGAAGLTVADGLACGWRPPRITHGEAQAPGRAPREHPVRPLSWYEA